MSVATIGIDLDKNSYSLAGLDGTGAVVLRRGSRGRGSSPSSLDSRPAWWRWRRAAARTTSGGSSLRRPRGAADLDTSSPA